MVNTTVQHHFIIRIIRSKKRQQKEQNATNGRARSGYVMYINRKVHSSGLVCKNACFLVRGRKRTIKISCFFCLFGSLQISLDWLLCLSETENKTLCIMPLSLSTSITLFYALKARYAACNKTAVSPALNIIFWCYLTYYQYMFLLFYW